VSKPLQNREFYEFGPFHLNVIERVLTKGRQVIQLTPKAFDTLVVLVRNSGHVVEKDKLPQQVWPDTFVEEGILTVNVAAVRKALSDGEDGRSYIETVPRRGYRFIGQVQQTVAATPNEPAKGQKLRVVPWGLAAGLLALVGVGASWYLSRSRPTSTEPPSQPVPLTSYPGAERATSSLRVRPFRHQTNMGLRQRWFEPRPIDLIQHRFHQRPALVARRPAPRLRSEHQQQRRYLRDLCRWRHAAPVDDRTYSGRETELVAGWTVDLFLFDPFRLQHLQDAGRRRKRLASNQRGGHESFESPTGGCCITSLGIPGSFYLDQPDWPKRRSALSADALAKLVGRRR
jgi:DNA-binding winged helix-turn-helix (wHTH) protein